MTERVCKGCGGELPNMHGNRRYCSERCRKRQYGDPCVECGAKTVYGAETRRVPNPRCDPCARRRKADRRVALVLAMLELRRTTQLTNVGIGRELGTPASTVATELHRLRALGFDFPVSSYNGSGGRRADSLAWDDSTRTLAVALRERGHHVPVCEERAA
jgi:hypothetical protein